MLDLILVLNSKALGQKCFLHLELVTTVGKIIEMCTTRHTWMNSHHCVPFSNSSAQQACLHKNLRLYL